MAGFMAGFGPAFAESFNAGNERNARRKEDEFRLMYQDYISKREQRSKWEREGAGDVRSAKSIAQTNGLSEDAWPQIYQWMKDGRTPKQIDELIQNGDFVREGEEENRVERPATPEAPTAPSVNPDPYVSDQSAPDKEHFPHLPKPAPVDQEMETSGMATPSTTNTPPPEPTMAPVPPQGDSGGIFTKLLGLSPFKRGGHNNSSDNVARIARISGTSPDEIRRTMEATPSTQMAQASPSNGKGGLTYRPRLGTGGGGDPDKIDTLNESSIELSEAEHAYTKNPTPETQSRYERAERRMTALHNAAVFKANTEADAQGLGIVSGTPAKVLVNTIDPETGKAKTSVVITRVERSSDGSLKSIDPNFKLPEGAQTRILPMQKEELSALEKISSVNLERQNVYLDKVTTMKSALHDAAEMTQLVDQTNGAVLAENAAGLAGKAQDWAVEVVTGLELVGNRLREGGEFDSKMFDQLEAKVNAALGQNINDLATANLVFTAKKHILAYRLAMMQGQTGRALSETERQIFEKLASGGNSGPKFKEVLASVMSGQMSSLSQEAQTFNDHNIAVRGYEQIYGPAPEGFNSVPTLDQLIQESDDPFVQSGYQIVQQYGPKMPTFNTGQPTASQSPQSQGPVQVQSVQDALKLPSGTVFMTPDGRTKMRP